MTYALLGSYTAQAEVGDYSEADHGTNFEYLNDLQFAPVQDDELLRRIHEQHKRHRYVLTLKASRLRCISRGQPPSAADLHFLENAKKLAMYGVDIHPAQVHRTSLDTRRRIICRSSRTRRMWTSTSVCLPTVSLSIAINYVSTDSPGQRF